MTDKEAFFSLSECSLRYKCIKRPIMELIVGVMDKGKGSLTVLCQYTSYTSTHSDFRNVIIIIITYYLTDAFIKSDIQLIRLSGRQSHPAMWG